MATTEKNDLFKELKNDDYKAAKKPEIITTRNDQYLTIQGKGAPGGDEFSQKVGALYGVAYTIKMTRKFSGEQDYVVGKLEAQWWGESKTEDFSTLPPEEWNWKLLMRVPQFIRQDDLEKSAVSLLEKGKDPEVKDVRLESIHEDTCVQMLHIGPYNKEYETIDQMNMHAEKEGYTFTGLHHEIYLSDPRRVPPERLKTILRMPIKKK